MQNRSKTSQGLCRKGENPGFYSQRRDKLRKDHTIERLENESKGPMDIFKRKLCLYAYMGVNAYDVPAGIKDHLADRVPASAMAKVLTAIQPQLADARAGRSLTYICLSCSPSTSSM